MARFEHLNRTTASRKNLIAKQAGEVDFDSWKNKSGKEEEEVVGHTDGKEGEQSAGEEEKAVDADIDCNS